MNTQSQDTQNSFAWNKLNLPDSNSWSTAVCRDHYDNVYVATWNGSSGQIYTPTSDGKGWTPVSNAYSDTINDMCCDSNGNVFAVGQASNGQYGLMMLNPMSKGFNMVPGSAQGYPINFVCADGLGNVYYTGNAVDTNGHIFVTKYDVQKTSLTPLSGGQFPSALTGLCADNNGTVYALGLEGGANPYISYYSGGSWSAPINSPNLDSGTLAITCDNSGNVYVPSSTTVWSYSIGTMQFTNMNAPMPGTAPMAVFMRWVQNILYVVGYSMNGATIQDFALAYGVPSAGWNTITPTGLNNGSTSINGISAYTRSSYNLLIANSQNALWDGKLLVH